MLGTTAVCTGSVHGALGVLAATAQDDETAARHFEAAIDTNRALGAPPLVAYTQFHYALMLHPHSPAAAADLCADAAATAARYGMRWLVEKSDALRRGLPHHPFQSQEAP